jgi:hypothetical protein
MNWLGFLVGGVIGIFFLAGVFGFVVAFFIMVTWNRVIPYLGGPVVTYWVAYNLFWLVAITGATFRGINYKSK